MRKKSLNGRSHRESGFYSCRTSTWDETLHTTSVYPWKKWLYGIRLTASWNLKAETKIYKLFYGKDSVPFTRSSGRYILITSEKECLRSMRSEERRVGKKDR